MAKAIRKRTIGPKSIAAGPQILDIVTTGMYNNPLMIVREYVQNAADSIDLAIQRSILTAKSARIDISLDGASRKLVIADNGVGIRQSQTFDLLCSIAVSTKLQNANRGFRGIGRLGGLGYCDAVRFETRARRERKVTTVVWHADVLRSLLSETRFRQETLSAIAKKCVTTSVRNASESDPESFFRVTLDNVDCFHKDELMNVPRVREYLSQVAPVPFASHFPYARQINHHLRDLPGYRAYNLFLNCKKIVRPHELEMKLSSKQVDTVSGIERFSLYNRERTKEIGRGWYAITNHLASIPTSVKMRGVRVRQGNIEIGDEYYLAEFFSERRFATWHIGEIHLCYDLKANARRDGFEHNTDHEAFLEQACLLGSHLSTLCRQSSTQRSQYQQIEHIKERLGQLGKVSLVPDEEQLAELSREERELRNRLKEYGERKPHSNGRMKTLVLTKALDGRSLRSVSKKDLLVDVSRRLAGELNDSSITANMLEKILQPYLKSGDSVKSQ